VTLLDDDAAAVTVTDGMVAGFLDAHARRVVGVPGGVIRARRGNHLPRRRARSGENPERPPVVPRSPN
jgi:hypothetical protein